MTAPVPDKTIIGFMKVIVNCETPMTETEESEYLDALFKMLKARRARKRLDEIKRIMRHG